MEWLVQFSLLLSRFELTWALSFADINAFLLYVAPAQVRHAYEQFLVAVSELLDGEVSSHELQQSASLIYDVIYDLDIAKSGPELNQKRYAYVFWDA